MRENIEKYADMLDRDIKIITVFLLMQLALYTIKAYNVPLPENADFIIEAVSALPAVYILLNRFIRKDNVTPDITAFNAKLKKYIFKVNAVTVVVLFTALVAMALISEKVASGGMHFVFMVGVPVFYTGFMHLRKTLIIQRAEKLLL